MAHLYTVAGQLGGVADDSAYVYVEIDGSLYHVEGVDEEGLIDGDGDPAVRLRTALATGRTAQAPLRRPTVTVELEAQVAEDYLRLSGGRPATATYQAIWDAIREAVSE